MHTAQVVPHPALLRAQELVRHANALRLDGYAQGHAVACYEHAKRLRRATDAALSVGIAVGSALGATVALALTGWFK